MTNAAKTDKCDFLIFRIARRFPDCSRPPSIEHCVVSVYGLARGLYDWSEGREILATIKAGEVLDVFTAYITWEQAENIRRGKAEPPGRAERLRAAGMEYLLRWTP